MPLVQMLKEDLSFQVLQNQIVDGHLLFRSGNMGIYEETFEKIAYRVKQAEEKKNKTVIPDGVDDDDALVSGLIFAYRKTDSIGLFATACLPIADVPLHYNLKR